MTQQQQTPTPTEFDGQDAVAKDPVPSWFARTYGEQDVAAQYRDHQAQQPVVPQPIAVENTAAYEAYRKRLEERFSSAQRVGEPHFMPQDNGQPAAAYSFPERPSYGQVPPRRLERPQPPAKAKGLSPITLAILTLSACVIGSGGGYVASNPDVAEAGLGFARSLWAPTPTVTSETIIAKKPVHSAKLNVKNASGAINSPIPLDIAAFAADAETPVALRISGLPPAAYLTKGVEVATGEWMVKAADIGKAELIVPHTDVPEIALQVAALEEKTGVPAAPAQKLMVALDTEAVPVPGVPQPKVDGPRIEPVGALPDQGFNKSALPAPVPAPLASINPEADSLIRKGDALLQTGDILAARQFYLRAFELKEASAAYGVGQTYDPAVFAKYKIKGLAADSQIAAEWYGKAAAAGIGQAADAMAALPAEP
jgi:hypothetical protein